MLHPDVDQAEVDAILRVVVAALAPAPPDAVMQAEFEKDRMANPHNDNHKAPRRSAQQVEWDLRFRWADTGIGTPARHYNDSFRKGQR